MTYAEMDARFTAMEAEFERDLASLSPGNTEQERELRSAYTGIFGKMLALLREMGTLEPQAQAAMGRRLNAFHEHVRNVLPILEEGRSPR